MFWILVILAGCVGAFADVVLVRWSQKTTLGNWVQSAVPYLVFMTILGMVFYLGEIYGKRMTFALLLVVFVNVAGFGVWDSIRNGKFSPFEILALLLVFAGVVCWEYAHS